MAMGVKVLLFMVVAGIIGIQALTKTHTNYCRNRRPSECCWGSRDDTCSVPIEDTLCYCDSFCLERDPEIGPHDDCCPDYREVCLGQTPPTTPGYLHVNETTVCIHNGVPLSTGNHTWNCNECVCDDGRLTCDKDTCMVDEEMIGRVNSDFGHYGWTATNYSKFWGKKAKEGLFMKTGTLIPDDKISAMLPIRLRPNRSSIPHEFDSRRKTEWRGLISGVRDQGWCGASWAFSTLGVAQDRLMILTRGQMSLAPQQLLSCSRKPQKGCMGDHIDRAWNYMRKNGVVEEQCFPYASGVSGEVPYCRIDPDFMACKLHRMEPAYRISSKEEDIQWEIMTEGPVQAVMWVKRDLFMYRSGVYRCPQMTGELTGLHSVRILGWGEDATLSDPPTKYWLVANSWGTDWGEGGLFRIRRGVNECGIESFVLAVRGLQERKLLPLLRGENTMWSGRFSQKQ